MKLSKISYGDLKLIKADLQMELKSILTLMESQRGRSLELCNHYQMKHDLHPNHEKIKRIDQELKFRLRGI